MPAFFTRFYYLQQTALDVQDVKLLTMSSTDKLETGKQHKETGDQAFKTGDYKAGVAFCVAYSRRC